MADQIVAALAAKPADDEIQIEATLDEMIQAYAACELKHLALENGVVLALARIRLTRADLTTIGRSMKLRRGVVVA